MIGRWRLPGSTSLHPDRFGGHRTYVFTGPAAVAELLVDPDSYSRNELDSLGVAAFHAGKTTAVSGQTLFVMGNGHLVFQWCRVEIIRITDFHGDRSGSFQRIAYRTDRLSE